MAEYIDKDKLLEDITADYDKWTSYNDNDELYRKGVADNYSDTIRLISEMPAADVQPVKRGKWEKKKGYLVCSNCGMTFDTIGYTYEEQEEVFRYCSCCGYRMDYDEAIKG